jgi:hypothetical protein
VCVCVCVCATGCRTNEKNSVLRVECGCERSVVMAVMICATAKQSAVGAVCRTNGDKMGATRVLVREPAGTKMFACVRR